MSKENYGNNEFDFDNILKEFGSLPDEPAPQPPVFEPEKKRIRFETQDDGSNAALIVSIEKQPSEPEDDPLMTEVDRIISRYRREKSQPELVLEAEAECEPDAEVEPEAVPEPVPESVIETEPAAEAEGENTSELIEREPTKKRAERPDKPENGMDEELYDGSGLIDNSEAESGTDDDDIADSALSDDAAENYAADSDYSEAQVEREPKAKRPHRSFREAVAVPVISALAFIAMRIKQSELTLGPASYEDEDLGEEEKPDKAARFYDRHIAGLRIRTRIAFLLCAVMIYISLGLPLAGALADTGIRSAVCLIMMLAVMICGLDITTTGIMSLARFKFHASSLIAVSCLLCMIDAFLSAASVTQKVIPFCVIPSLTIACTLLGCILNARSNRIVFNTAHSARSPYTLTAESELTGGDITLVKARGTTAGIVRRTEEEGPDEAVFGVLTPYFIVAALVLSIIAAAVSKNFAGFAHIFSGIFVCAAPMAMLLTFPMPFYVSVKGLIKSGLTIAGWSGLYDIGKAKHLIVTDADLFPKGSIKIGKVCILSHMDASEVMSYASSIIGASGCAMAGAFASLMAKAGGHTLPVDDFTVHESGGLRAMVDGKEVFCGDAAFMRLMGVVLPEKYVVRGGVYVAAASAICGVFEVKYEAFDAVKDALYELMSSGRHAVFALRDFNITPQMLSVKFDIPTDGFDFPPYAQRYELSGAVPGEGSKPAAVISREGLGSLVSLAGHGKALFSRIRLCVMLSVMSAVIGIALMFILSLNAMPGVTVALIYLMVWLLISVILSFTVSTP